MYVPEGARIWHRQGPVHGREQVLVPTSEKQSSDPQNSEFLLGLPPSPPEETSTRTWAV